MVFLAGINCTNNTNSRVITLSFLNIQNIENVGF